MKLLMKLFLTAGLIQTMVSLKYRPKFSEWSVKELNHQRASNYIRPIMYSERLVRIARSKLIKTLRLCNSSSCKGGSRKFFKSGNVLIDSGVHQNCRQAMKFVLDNKYNSDLIRNNGKWCEPWNTVGSICLSNRVMILLSKSFDPNGRSISPFPNFFIYESFPSCGKLVKFETDPSSSNKNEPVPAEGYTVPEGYPEKVEVFYFLVNSEREKYRLPPIPFSPELSKVAQAKSENMDKYLFDQPDYFNKLHDWFGEYDCDIWQHPLCMVTKPSEFSDYKERGYEISFGGKDWKDINATDIFINGWMESEGHKNVTLSAGYWKDYIWQAVGVGFTHRTANIWFGLERDPHYP